MFPILVSVVMAAPVNPNVLITHLPDAGVRVSTFVMAQGEECTRVAQLTDALRTRARYRVVYDPVCVDPAQPVTPANAFATALQHNMEVDSVLLVTVDNQGVYHLQYNGFRQGAVVEQWLAWNPNEELSPGPFPPDERVWTVPGCNDGEAPLPHVQDHWLERETLMWPPVEPRPVHVVYEGRRVAHMGPAMMTLLEGEAGGRELQRSMEQKWRRAAPLFYGGTVVTVVGFPLVILGGMLSLAGMLLGAGVLGGLQAFQNVPWALLGGVGFVALVLMGVGMWLFLAGFPAFFGGLVVRTVGNDMLRVPVRVDQARVDRGVEERNNALLDEACGAPAP